MGGIIVMPKKIAKVGEVDLERECKIFVIEN
jgi:hypothetical protein